MFNQHENIRFQVSEISSALSRDRRAGFKEFYDSELGASLLEYGVGSALFALASPVLVPAGIAKRGILEAREAHRRVNGIKRRGDTHDSTDPAVSDNWKFADEMTASPIIAPLEAAGALAASAIVYTAKIVTSPYRLAMFSKDTEDRRLANARTAGYRASRGNDMHVPAPHARKYRRGR